MRSKAHRIYLKNTPFHFDIAQCGASIFCGGYQLSGGCIDEIEVRANIELLIDDLWLLEKPMIRAIKRMRSKPLLPENRSVAKQ